MNGKGRSKATKRGEKPEEGDSVKLKEKSARRENKRVLNTGEYFLHNLTTWKLL